MERDIFEFKHFKVSHGSSSMKIGVDGVLLGAWAGEMQPKTILDVGTGCGVIAMILKYRFPLSKVMAIDIDSQSVEEAELNIRNSEFDENTFIAKRLIFPEGVLSEGKKYDLIVSNPPYFKSGIGTPATRRERARHQDSLSVYSLIDHAGSLLNPDGRLAVIFPMEQRDDVIEYAIDNSLTPIRECRFRDNEKRPEKRLMIEFSPKTDVENKKLETEFLTLFENGEPTERYRELCGELYLKF